MLYEILYDNISFIVYDALYVIRSSINNGSNSSQPLFRSMYDLGNVADRIGDPKSTTGEKSWSTNRSSDDLNVFNDKPVNWINFSV